MSVLSSAARKLVVSNGDLAVLTPRERKGAIELFWLRIEGWAPRIQDIHRWLEWASRDWSSRIGVTRAMMSFIRNLDLESDGTRELSTWLAGRTDLIVGPFGEFARGYRFLEGERSIEAIAGSLAAGRVDFFKALERDIRCRTVVQGSGLLVAVVAGYGAKCSAGATVDTEAVCRRLLSLLGASGLAGARGSDGMKDRARICMISGIVGWAEKRGERQSDVDVALEIAMALAGDPRMSMIRWEGVDERVVEVVEAWLTARTVENTFMVMEELRTDRQDMVEQRLAFWRAYLPYIRKAFLLCGRKAEPIAERLKERYGTLHGMEADHCGLLLQIIGPRGDRITVVDFNKNASALFWNSSKPAPGFFRDFYIGSDLRASASSSQPHNPTHRWPSKFADLIEGETGIRQAFERTLR
jgi:hypothetical protein